MANRSLSQGSKRLASANCQHIQIISRSEEASFNNDWYEFAIESHFWLQWRFAAMLLQLDELGVSLKNELKVLEIGSGRGVLAAQVESFSNYNVDGAELNLDALLCAKQSRGRKMLYNVRDECELLLEAYDMVILFDVLEHVRDTRSFLSSVLRHLKSRGLLLLNVPALGVFYSAYDEIMGHLRRYNRKTLAKEFEWFDFKIIDMRYWGLAMVPLLAVRKLMMLTKRPNAQTVRRGFEPPSALAHRVLRVVMRAETSVLGRPPVGSSLLMVGKKL